MDSENEKPFYNCRGCLVLSHNTYPIFQNIPESNITIATMLNSCSIEIGDYDEFPNRLCLTCFGALQTVYNFIQTFKRSQELLLCQYLKQNKGQIIVINEDETHSNINAETDKHQPNISEIDNLVSQFDKSSADPENHEQDSHVDVLVNTNDGDQQKILDESDDQDVLIEQSVQLTQHCKIHKLDNESDSEHEQKEINDYSYEENKNGGNENNLNVHDNSSSTAKSSNSLVISCPLCSKTFKRFGLFSNHLTHHNQAVTCRQCSAQFGNADTYLEHYQVKHRYQCKICQQCFPRGDTYNRHMQAHNNTLPKFRCPVENCSKTFTVRQSLRNHYKTIHCDKHNFLCNLCGISFKNYDNLRYHMKKHKGPSHLCTYCGRRFMQAVHLTYHMWRHTGVKPYKCSNCEKSFVSKKVLVAHIKRNCKSDKNDNKVVA